MKIAILGAGNVGQALATGWLRRGHTITFGSRQPTGDKAQAIIDAFAGQVQIRETAAAAAQADTIVLAVPWGAAESVVKGVGDLAGKILIDATNPIGAGLQLAVGKDVSGAELIQNWATNARVVKAFNTTGYDNMLDPIYNGESTTMFIAGDDAAAKSTVTQLAEALGFDVADCGNLQIARYLEPLAMVWIQLALVQRQSRDLAFKLVKR